MSESTLVDRPGDKLISAAGACRLTGLGYRQFLRTAAAAKLRIVQYPGLPAKYGERDIHQLIAESQAVAQPDPRRQDGIESVARPRKRERGA